MTSSGVSSRFGRAASRTLIAVSLLAILAAGCGSDKKKVLPTATTASTTTKATTATTSAPTTATSSARTTASSGDAAAAWEQDAQPYRGQNGKTYTIDCTANGTKSMVWGAGTYTDDSSICTAAVQSGLITFAEGGTVTYKIAPGQDSYDAGTANGVESSDYGSWGGSFTLPDAPPGTVDIAASPESWSQTASSDRGQDGKRLTLQCSAGGTTGSVWGSGPYTDDSSICTAAVHAGLITTAAGGTVVAEIAPGEASYKGTTANGVTTSDYGSFAGSFTFPSDQTPG